MRKFLSRLTAMLMAVIAWVSAAPDAEAITPEDLDGKPVMQVFFGNIYQGEGPTVSTAGVFRYDAANSQLYIDRFRGRISVPVEWDAADQCFYLPLKTKLTGGTGNYRSLIMDLVQGQSWNIIRAQGVFNGQIVTAKIGTTINQRPAACYMTDKFAQYESVGTTAYSTAPHKYVDMPNFVLDGSDYPYSLLCVNSPTNNVALNTAAASNNYGIAIYKQIAFYVMERINAHASDSNGDNYDLQIAFTNGSDTQLQFENLYNQGIRYEYYSNAAGAFTGWDFKWITGEIDRSTNTITIPYDITGGMMVPTTFDYMRYQSGRYNQNYYYDYGYMYNFNSPIYWTGYWFNNVVDGYANQVLASDMPSNGSFRDITGSFEVKEVSHVTPHHQWAHTAKGELHTYEKWDVTIDKSVFYNQAATTTYNYGVELNYDWTNIDVDYIDVTHHCEITDWDAWQYDNILPGQGNCFEMKGKITPLKHNHHVDVTSYDLYLVPGYYDKPEGDLFNDENGHAHGIKVTDYVDPRNMKTNSLSTVDDGSFHIVVPTSVFTDAGIPLDSNKDFTLYVRAKYATPGLDDTFHALTPVRGSYSTTAIPEVFGEDAGFGEQPVQYFDLNGRMVSEPLSSGIYIRKQGNKVEKIIR